MPSTTVELNDLIAEIIYNTVDLLDHRFREYFYFNADFSGSDRASCHKVAWIGDGDLTRDNFAESSIATAGSNAAPLVLGVKDAIFSTNRGLNQFWRATYCDEILQ